MKPTLVSISEEIVRWSFEVTVNKSEDWFIAFTNPTAGPWKRITAPNAHGAYGEIHRFEIDETRPDLVLINDKLRDILIVEAKTEFSDLQKNAQLEKTTQLFCDLSSKLEKNENVEFWGDRSKYNFKLGLLWSSGKESADEIKQTCERYLKEVSHVTSDVVCIEGFFENDSLITKSYNGTSGVKLSIPN
jgi:hypothetical protein